MERKVKMHGKIKIAFFTLFAGLIMAAFFESAPASEFSADIIMKGDLMSAKGKVWVKGQKMRQAFGNEKEEIITIMDLDQGLNWVLMPQSKTYIKTKIETKGKGFRPQSFIGMQKGQTEAQVKLAATETLNGYECDKYLITFKDKKMGIMTQWFAVKLNYPIKMINKNDLMGEAVTELRNIAMGGVEDAFFRIPEGYKETPQPQVPEMP
jgi:hypothetical protein